MTWRIPTACLYCTLCTKGISDLLHENSFVTELSGLALHEESEPCVEAVLDILTANIFKNVGEF
jgi:hypothetical protein